MRKLAVFLMFAAGGAAAVTQGGKTAQTSLTGCVDELEADFVLTHSANLRPLVRLRPTTGAPEDHFARYMGDKSLKVISQTCGPASEAEPK